MQILVYSAIAVLSITAVCIIFFALKSGRPLKTLLLNALVGIAAIAAIDLTSKFTGIWIPINGFSVTGGAVYGLPAVCGMLILRLILV